MKLESRTAATVSGRLVAAIPSGLSLSDSFRRGVKTAPWYSSAPLLGHNIDAVIPDA
jgi:hypothetical protein